MEDVRSSWANAEEGSRFIRRGLDYHRRLVHGRALLEACGDVRDRQVLDLGCGEGWCCRELAHRGASVVGVDICEAQVEMARVALPESGRVEYRVMDAAEVDGVPWDTRFDLATACMALHCMVDPGAVLGATRRVLASGGRLVCSVPHPFTHMLGGRRFQREPSDGSLVMTVGRYFDAAAYSVSWDLPRTGTSWKTIRWSRSFGDYWRIFTDAGFVVVDVLEPKPTSDALRECPELRDTAEIPYYMIFVAKPMSDIEGTTAATAT